jgi:hypothetical protein
MFLLCGSACRDDPGPVVAFRKNHRQKDQSDHSDYAKPILAIGIAVRLAVLDSKWVCKNIRGRFEIDAMLAAINARLGIVPFEGVALRTTAEP